MVKLYQNLSEPDYVSISQCFVHLNDPASAAKLLEDLVSKDEDVSKLAVFVITNITNIAIIMGLRNLFYLLS